MFIFSLGEKTPLDKINAKAPADSLAFAYADNVYLLAKKKKKNFLTLWELAEAELACAHYSIKRSGCYIYPINQSFDPESESHFFPEGVKITTEGFTALNIPFGNESY